MSAIPSTTLYNKNGPVLVNVSDVEARLASGFYWREPVKTEAVKPEPVKSEPAKRQKRGA